MANVVITVGSLCAAKKKSQNIDLVCVKQISQASKHDKRFLEHSHCVRAVLIDRLFSSFFSLSLLLFGLKSEQMSCIVLITIRIMFLYNFVMAFM